MLAVATGRLEAQLDRWLDRNFHCPDNPRLAKHLRHEQPHLFTFLRCPGLHATNNFTAVALDFLNHPPAGAPTPHAIRPDGKKCAMEKANAPATLEAARAGQQQ